MSSSKKFEDLNLSQDEISRLTKALKDEEFRKLFVEYAQEISDPENRKRYEEEIAMLENEKGMDVKFIKPNPGHVIKTTYTDNTKVFFNICKNEHIEEAKCSRQTGPGGKSGLSWSIPHSFAPIKDDVDKKGGSCKVIDFVVHPNTYRMAETNRRFMNMINDTALDSAEKQFGIKLDKKNYHTMQNMKFKGVPSSTVIRTRKDEHVAEADPDDPISKLPYPYDDKTSAEKAQELAEKHAEESQDSTSNDVDDPYQRPTFIIKHRNDFDFQNFTQARDSRSNTRPNELSIEIDLPLLKSAASVDLDIFEKKLRLKSENPAKYQLEINLPYEVDENKGNAKFDKSKRRLVVTLPVIPKNENHDSLENVSIAEDSGNEEHDCDSMATGKPMIEVLSSKDAQIESTDEAKKGNLSDDSAVHSDQDQENGKISESVSSAVKPEVFYSVPQFDYLQNDETVTIILEIKNASRESLVRKIMNDDDKGAFEIVIASIGPGGFPMHYKFYAQFENGCLIDDQASYVDVDVHNVVMTIVKTDQSLGPWERFTAGLGPDNVEEKLFLTEHNIQARFSQLDDEQAGNVPPNKEDLPDLEVTDMSTSQLVVDIKENNGSSNSISESAEEIEVIHNKEKPKLQGILKQRSRTTSESSDDIFGSPYARQQSTGGESSPTSPVTEESENETSDGGRKKSVSFSEQVDRTMYKSSQSVTSMRCTLKNKRKKAQKKEKKQAQKEMKRQSRRRRSSNSLSEPSSDDTGADKRSDSLRYEDDEFENGDLEETDSTEASQESDSKSVEESVSNTDKEVELTESENGDCVKGTKAKAAVNRSDRNGVCDKYVKGNSHALTNGVHGDKERTCDSDDGDEVDDTEGPIVSSGNASKSRVQELGPGDQQQVREKPDTALNWAENPNHNQYNSQCAFEFSNSVMYDLDLD